MGLWAWLFGTEKSKSDLDRGEICINLTKKLYKKGPPRVSSVRNHLEKVGDFRDITILVQSNLHF